MRLSCLFVLLSCLCPAQPVHLLCNHLLNPLGIDSMQPRLSWQSDNTQRNWHQSAYQILVATDSALLKQGKGDVWDSGKIASAQSVGVIYGGPKPASRVRYFWTVKVWDAAGKSSESAAAAWWEMGLLSRDDWQASWITRANTDEAPDRAAMKWLALPQGTQNLPAQHQRFLQEEI